MSEDHETVRVRALADHLRPALRAAGTAPGTPTGATALAHWAIHTEKSLLILLGHLHALQLTALDRPALEDALTEIRFELEHVFTHVPCQPFLDGIFPPEAITTDGQVQDTSLPSTLTTPAE